MQNNQQIEEQLNYDNSDFDNADLNYEGELDYDYGYEEYAEEQNQYAEYDHYGYAQDISPDTLHKDYEILPYNALFEELIKSLKTAQQMTALHQGWCLLLLRDFKWDIDLLTEYFTDMEKYRNNINYKQNYRDPNQHHEKTGNCEVCCSENVRLIENICSHGFCIDCWKSQLETAINSNNPFPKCLGCQCPVLYQTVIKLLKICYPEDRKMLDRYEKVLCELFSSVHRNYQFCTGVDCNNCIKVYNLNVQTVRCTCGKSFCFKCNSDDHSPCTCEERKKWTQNVLKEEADAKWMSAHAKLCPWCKKAVERSAGCNFMACVCGKNFCYLCSRPWEPDHKDHFKCHIYKKSNEQQVNRQKQILQKMNFFTERFLQNQANANSCRKIDTFDMRKYLFKTLKVDLFDSEFIDAAYKFSIECCETLKWIYAYSYYVKWKNAQEKENFQFYQGEFQKYKQNLLKKLAIDLKGFLKQVTQKQQNGQLNQRTKQQLMQQFKTLKSSIINYATMTKTYKEKFVAEIEHRNENQELMLIQKKSQEKTKKITRTNSIPQSKYNNRLQEINNKKSQNTVSGKFLNFISRDKQ